MLKSKIAFCLLLFSNLTFAQSFDNISISTGVTYSNVTTQKEEVLSNNNPFRYGFWISANYDLSFKKWFSLDLGVTYQERMAMEFFYFPDAPNSRAGTIFIRDYPSNPQHEFFKVRGVDAFPNFQYLHLEAIPSINFGKKIKTSVGIGIFGGTLLNKNQTTRTAEDFPELIEGFQALGVTGAVEYSRFDFGIIPKINCLYHFSENIGIGVELKSYHSLTRMNDSLVDSPYVFNYFWLAYSGGLCLHYGF